MHLSTPTGSDQAHPGDYCEKGRLVSAFHDGELDTELAKAMETHVSQCAICREELDDLRELSAQASRLAGGHLSAIAMARIHRAIDAEARDDRYAIFRIASVLTGLAASVLVIGAVWLSEFPGTQPGTRIVINPDAGPDWSRVAVDLRADPPLPRAEWEVDHQQMFADTRTAQWMIDGLGGR